MRHSTLLAALVASACVEAPAEDLPPVQAEGTILSYAWDHEVCDATVPQAEAWMIAVADQLGIARSELEPTTYYRLSADQIDTRCTAAACFRVIDDEQRIYAPSFLNRHELVHAIQRSAWPRRRALLTEGLATLFDDTERTSLIWAADHEIDYLIEAPRTDPIVYFAGAWLVRAIILRHGAQAFHEFWLADSEETDAQAFRVLFEQHFGETLEAMIGELQGEPACNFVTCSDEVVPWSAGTWTAQWPSACGPDVVGHLGPDPYFERYVNLEIPAAGSYVVEVSASDDPAAYADVTGCSECAMSSFGFGPGSSSTRSFEAGRYRVRLSGSGADSIGITIQPE